MPDPSTVPGRQRRGTVGLSSLCGGKSGNWALQCRAMNDTLRGHGRLQSVAEEIANSISHGIGLIAAACATPVLIVVAALRDNILATVGVSIFGASMILMYAASTIYHAIPHHRETAKSLFRLVDHGAIYLLIAGTYTPFTLTVLHGTWGWTLLVVIWCLAFAGLLLKGLAGTGHPVLSAGLYLGMGWIVLIAIVPLWQSMPGWGLFWLCAGGIAYTLGVVFFLLDARVRFAHFVWHLFVLAGTACHFVAVLLYTD